MLLDNNTNAMDHHHHHTATLLNMPPYNAGGGNQVPQTYPNSNNTNTNANSNNNNNNNAYELPPPQQQLMMTNSSTNPHPHHHHPHHQMPTCNLDGYLFSTPTGTTTNTNSNNNSNSGAAAAAANSAIGGGDLNYHHHHNHHLHHQYPHHHHLHPHHPHHQMSSSDVSLTQLGGGTTTTSTSSTSSGGAVAAAASSAVVAAAAASGDLPDTKYYYIEELCPVCGDKVSGYHYGLLTCESCKGFFKRTVQNKKVYTCVAERSCHIDKTQRKRCPFCRFQKCLEVGMKLEAVRADRMRGGRNKFGPMYKRDRARKLQLLRQRQLAAQTLVGTLVATDSSGAGLYTTAQSSNNNNNNNSASSSSTIGGGVSAAAAASSSSSASSPFANIHIKQEIQIPQVSSLTSSPDSSPSPIAVALGQVGGAVSASALHITGNATALQSQQVGGGGVATLIGGGGGDSKLWHAANSTTTSPHSLSPRTFQFDGTATGGGPGGGGGGGGVGVTVTNPTNNNNNNHNNNNNNNNNNNSSKVSPLIRDFLQAIDDREWQNSLYGLLQSQTYNQCEVDLFELMCKVLDQNLFSQVDWARNSVFFKDLKVDDQMKLLQHSWSDMLVLDHIHQRMHNNLPDETTLHNGQKFDLLSLGLLGVPSLVDHFNDITAKFEDLKVDIGDYICVKFLLLLNPDVRGITNRRHVQEGYEQVQQALLEYTVTCYPQIVDKFNKMMQLLPEIHDLAVRGEEYLYHKHCSGSAPTQTLLMEMLHAKRK